MFVSVVICTYRRADDLETLLDCLVSQQYKSFEVLVVDGSGDDAKVRERVAEFTERRGESGPDVRLIQSPAGLTRQRNVGLREFRGDLVCFLDDDVTVGDSFLPSVVDAFAGSDSADVGGVGGLDPRQQSMSIPFRWRLRRFLRTINSLEPGHVDHLGRAIPLKHLGRFSGSKDVGWIPGYCMIFRRDAVSQLQFDEQLPTYAAEERDFCIQVRNRWRLVLCSDLEVLHHCSKESRVSEVNRVFQCGFGAGRGFAKHAGGIADYFRILHCLVGELMIDMVAFVAGPSRAKLLMAFARVLGTIQGFQSFSGTSNGPARRRTD